VNITDLRTCEVLGHGYSTYVRVFTDDGVYGTGECIHGGDGCPQLIGMMKPVLVGEDPLDVDRLFEKMRRASRTPICAGENLYLRWGFRELFEKNAVDVVMPNIPKCGGLSEGRKIANLAELYYIPFAPHNVCGPLGTVASAHVCASVPNFLVLEWHWRERPYWHELVVADEPLIQRGRLRIPDRPGLGCEVNEDALQRHLRPGTELWQ